MTPAQAAVYNGLRQQFNGLLAAVNATPRHTQHITYAQAQAALNGINQQAAALGGQRFQLPPLNAPNFAPAPQTSGYPKSSR